MSFETVTEDGHLVEVSLRLISPSKPAGSLPAEGPEFVVDCVTTRFGLFNCIVDTMSEGEFVAQHPEGHDIIQRAYEHATENEWDYRNGY